MNLEETVQQELATLVDTGKVQEIIKVQLEKTLTDIVSNTMRSYSDFGKSLEVYIKEAMQIDFSVLSTLQYQRIIMDIIQTELSNNVQTHIYAPISKSIQALIAPLEKRDYKLSEIVEKFKESEVDEREGELTLVVEISTYGSIHIGLDRESDKISYNCEVRFSLNKEQKIYSFEVEKYGQKHNQTSLTKKSLHGDFNSFLFNLYAAGCVIVVDEDDCEREWYND